MLVVRVALIQTALKVISHFPQMLVAENFPGIYFGGFCLSLDEEGAQTENHHVFVNVWINFALCTCLSGGCIGDLCLSFVLLSQIEPDSHVQYPVMEHS